MRRIVVLAVAVFAVACVDARAGAPVLHAVGQQDRHPTATFSVAGADDVTVSIATKPDRATDGGFLSENVESVDSLTTEEIALGSWLDAYQLDPGTFYVKLRALSFDCFENPDCLTGDSNVLTLTVPEPRARYRGTVSRLFSIVSLKLTVKPLGEARRYRVCWTRASGRRRCLRGTVDGYDWNASASDEVTVRTRGLRRVTRFTWYADEDRVASKRVRVRRG